MFADKQTREAREQWADKQREAAKLSWRWFGALLFLLAALFCFACFYHWGFVEGWKSGRESVSRPERTTPL